MKNFIKKHKYILMVSIFGLLCVVDTVFAKTIVDIDICEFQSTLRLMKLLGVVLILVKIIIPLIMIFMCLKDGFKAVMSGKQEDLVSMLPMFFKRLIASALIFFAPTIVDFAVDSLVEYDDSAFKECTTCLFEPDNCVIPDKDPELYVEEKDN